MSWWNIGFDCLRCNNKGVIPVLSAKQQGNRLIPVEEIYACSCEKAKDLYTYTEKEYTTDEGKRKKGRIKKILSTRFDDVFNETQFKWTEEIMKSRNPYIDYMEVYLASHYLSVRTMNEINKFSALTDFDYLENQKGLGMSQIFNNFKLKMRELKGK